MGSQNHLLQVRMIAGGIFTRNILAKKLAGGGYSSEKIVLFYVKVKVSYFHRRWWVITCIRNVGY
jgi:hypothetical protein